MSREDQRENRPSGEHEPREGHAARVLGRSPSWARWLLIGAIVLMVVGVTWPMLSSGGEASTSGSGGTIPGGASLIDGGTPTETRGASETRSIVSSGTFRLGFSFAAAYAVGYALRAFFKFSLASLGFFALALFGLQRIGFITIHWDHFGNEHVDSFTTWLSSQFESVKSFVTGALPSGAAASAGIFAGWRRRD